MHYRTTMTRQFWLRTSLLAATCALAACSRPAGPSAAPPVAVVTQARPSDTTSNDTFPGTVQARVQTAQAFRIGGQLRHRYVHLGQAVHKGQLLAELDPLDAQTRLQGALAQQQAANARLTQAQAQAQRSTAQSEESLISASENEQNQAAASIAQADVSLAASQSDLAKQQAGYTRLLASHDGIITSEDADDGNVVAAGQKIVGLAWTPDTDVVVDVPELRIAEFHAGTHAQVRLPGIDGAFWPATVREVAQAAQTPSHTFQVKLGLDKAAPPLKLGMTVQVTLNSPPGTENLRIPATALFHEGLKTAVWVLGPTDHRLALRPVTVSAFGESSVDISAGLQPGETVLALGVHTVTAGMVVSPQPLSTDTP